MPGTILTDDAAQFYTDRLQQHAQNAFQAVQGAVGGAAQAVTAAPQELASTVSSVDPGQIIQNLQQHAQDAWQSVQQQPQAPQVQMQPAQVAVEPGDITQRLQDHATAAFQAVDQGAQQIGAGLQQAVQPVQQAVQQAVTPTQPTPMTPTSTAPPDRSMSLQDYARAAAQRAGIDPDIFVAQIQQESGFTPTAKSPAGAIGIAQFMPQTAAGMNVDPTDPYAALDAAAQLDAQNLKKYNGDYAKTLAAYNAGGGAVDQYNGVPPYQETQSYVSSIMQNAKSAVGGAVQGAQQVVQGAAQGVQQAASNVLPAVSQFGDKQLTAAEAYAACGPAAAVRFAQMYGRNPTLREATDLAANVGWTQDTGMAGLQSESKLFDAMNIPHRVVGADWQGLAREAQSGNPVTISTPGHYFTADAYDPQSGAFHVGSSGTDLKGGSEWMTPAQMEARMGPLQGGLAADNPGTPAASPLAQKPTGAPSGPIQGAQALVEQGTQAIGSGLQQVDNAVQGAVQGVQGAVTGAVQGVQQAVSGAVQGVQEAAGGAVQGVRTAAQQAADTAGAGLPDVTGTLKPENIPLGGAQSPLGKIAQGQKVTPVEQLEAAPQVPLGYEQSRSQAAAGVDPLRNLPGGNVIGPIVEAMTDPASWVGVGSARNAVGVGTSVAASVAAQQAAQNVISDNDPNKDVKVAIVSLLGAFTGAPIGEATVAPLLDRADSIVRGLGADGASALVQRVAGVADSVGARVAPAVTDFLQNAPAVATSAATRVASALTDILRPDIAAPQLEQAIRTVNESDATAPEITQAIDQVQKMPGGGAAPVRQQVPQSSTDLLQAMLDAARAKGADPDKLTALEQQIAAMDPAAATRRALDPAARQLAQASPRFAATLGGAVAGGAAGNATTPDNAMTIGTPFGDIPIERGVRIAAGAGIGAGLGSAAAGLAGARGTLPQDVLNELRAQGVVGGGQQSFVPLASRTPSGLIPRIVSGTKQAMLSNPATHTAYVIGNVLELLRSPAALAMGGRGDDAIAGMTSVARGIPAAADAARAALSGTSLPTLANAAAPIGRHWYTAPVYRALGAVHAFSRTLGEYQGMAQEASRLLREGGLSPNDPDAAAYLAAHANQIYDQGRRTGAGAVFVRPNTAAEGNNLLDNMFRRYSSVKDGMLASPDPKQQALGALMDFGIPFSGIPTQMLNIGMNRLPGPAQVSGAVRAAKALKAGDMGAAQRAIGETGLESTIQLMIAKQIADGNITGADDPDHPDSVRLNGNWVDMKDMGAWALPLRIMASWADGYAKGGQNIPPGTPGASLPEQTYNYYGPRFAGALSASMKPFAQAVPGEQMMKFLVDMGSGQGVGPSLTGLGSSAVSRVAAPGLARFVENVTDPVARDVEKKGVSALWEPAQSAIPGLAGKLAPKIDPTTGQPMQKASSGLGIFLGAKNDVASPLSIEAARLNKAGFSVTAPKTYPTDVTIGGSKVSLSPDEQREVAQITGNRLDQLASRLDSSEYQNAPDARKAQMVQAMITAADASRVAAVTKVLGTAELRSRVNAGRNVAGQLVEQAAPPDPFAYFNPLSGETIHEQRALAGVR